MYLFYLLSLIPICIGLYIHYHDEKVSLYEWLLGSGLSLLLAATMHLIAYWGMTGDIETWSGQITSARHFSAWLEYYEYAVYREECHEVGSGKDAHEDCEEVFDHWQPTTEWHPEYWMCYSNIGTDYSVSQEYFEYFVKKFNDKHQVMGVRQTWEHDSHMLKGDPYDYVADNKTGWIEPITKLRRFENRIKAAPSVFSFIEVPKDIPVFPYPKNNDHFHSDRLLGIAAKHINLFAFDQMNVRLGPTKQVNVIIAGFIDKDSSLADYQQAKWTGGKKNDLCLLYGWDSKQNKIQWARVFGWSESEICKRNLEWILLNQPINNSIIPYVEGEIREHYKIKDWHKFDYLAIEPRTVHFIWFFILMILLQTGLYFLFDQREVLPNAYYNGERV